MAPMSCTPHSKVFKALFAKEVTKANILLDQGGEDDFLSAQLLKIITKMGTKLKERVSFLHKCTAESLEIHV